MSECRLLIACDLDDTLVPRPDGRTSDRALAGIAALQHQGHVFAPVTGRCRVDMPRMVGPRSAWDTGAYANGQEVYVNGRLVHREPLDVDALDALVEVLDQGPLANLLVYQGGTEELHPVTRRPERLARYRSRENERAGAPVPSAAPLAPVKANIQFGCEDAAMRELLDGLRAQFPCFDFTVPGQGIYEADLLPAGWDKAQALRPLLEALSIDKDAVVAFGDSDTDLGLLRAARWSYGVANGNERVRAAADGVLGDVHEDAVGRALERLAAGAEPGELGEPR